MFAAVWPLIFTLPPVAGSVYSYPPISEGRMAITVPLSFSDPIIGPMASFCQPLLRIISRYSMPVELSRKSSRSRRPRTLAGTSRSFTPMCFRRPDTASFTSSWSESVEWIFRPVTDRAMFSKESLRSSRSCFFRNSI